MNNILENIKLVVLDIDIWTGRRSLTESDLKLEAGKELPPTKLASLGSKLVMDPEKLAVFHNLKTEAIRAVLRVGTRFLGAFAVPSDKMEELMAKLNTIVEEFTTKKQEFMDGYNAALEDWVKSNPGWESIIRNDAISSSVAEAKLKFGVQVIEVAPVAGYEDGLKKEVDGLTGQLRQEIEIVARATWKQSFKGKAKVTQKALRPIRAMVSKIKGLAFIEPALDELVEGLEETLSSIPTKGMIEGHDLASACGILAVLGNIPEAETILQVIGQEEDDEETAELDFNRVPAPDQPVRAEIPSEWF